MPIYEFECNKCNIIFERLLRISASDEKIACPKCGGMDIIKKFSIFGVVSKGTPVTDVKRNASNSKSCSSCSSSSCSTCR